MKTRIIKTAIAFATPFFCALAGGVEWRTGWMGVTAAIACVCAVGAWLNTGRGEKDQ